MQDFLSRTRLVYPPKCLWCLFVFLMFFVFTWMSFLLCFLFVNEQVQDLSSICLNWISCHAKVYHYLFINEAPWRSSTFQAQDVTMYLVSVGSCTRSAYIPLFVYVFKTYFCFWFVLFFNPIENLWKSIENLNVTAAFFLPSLEVH